MKESERALTERMVGQISGEVHAIRAAYLGDTTLEGYLAAIEGYVDIALGCLELDEPSDEECREMYKRSIAKIEGNTMNPEAIIAAIKIFREVLDGLPEETKREIDKRIDKIEDRFKQGSTLDLIMERAMKIVRGDELPDYPDVIDEKPEA